MLRKSVTITARPSFEFDLAIDPIEQFRSPDRTGSYLGVSKHGFHRIAYVEWGDPQSERVAICLHGLSRQGRDFDLMAAELARRGWRVICPDLVGRGRSDWLREPTEYTLAQYVADLAALVARLDVERIDWIGTSLGGIVGMLMAGQRQSPVGRLVVNDIGPFVTWQVLQRLADAVRAAPLTMPDLSAATDFVRTTLSGFGPLSDEKWEHMARHGFAENNVGAWRKLADSDIAGPLRSSMLFNLSIWNYWDQIQCPTLVLRGTRSDVLTAAIATEMTQRGPRAGPCRVPRLRPRPGADGRRPDRHGGGLARPGWRRLKAIQTDAPGMQARTSASTWFAKLAKLLANSPASSLAWVA